MFTESLEPNPQYLQLLISEAQTRGIKRLKFGQFEIEFFEKVSFEVVEPPSKPEPSAVPGGPLGLGMDDEEDDEITPDTIQFPGAVRPARAAE